MNKIKMLKIARGSEDGITVATYYEGKEYQVSDALLQSFISEGVCEIVEDVNPKVDNKAVESVPVKKTRKKK